MADVRYTIAVLDQFDDVYSEDWSGDDAETLRGRVNKVLAELDRIVGEEYDLLNDVSDRALPDDDIGDLDNFAEELRTFVEEISEGSPEEEGYAVGSWFELWESNEIRLRELAGRYVTEVGTGNTFVWMTLV